ncbi:bifunctional nuclease family protein [Microbacterium sp. NPDC055910]|uniref:bifunctional nuclease family protein n=1 Tax=Microbacterium sp. NPDC055910 TaxID=3345659 RepID=UPI0035DCD36B
MVQVRVAGIALDESGQHVLLLKPIDQLPGAGRMLPIWIGALEATSILIAVEGASVPRPLAHDLMKGVIESVDASVERTEITRIDDGTYYAEITLVTPGGIRIIDARPSDAVALASRAGAALWVADAVMEEAGVPDLMSDEVDAEESVDEFKRFLNDVDPDDFRG